MKLKIILIILISALFVGCAQIKKPIELDAARRDSIKKIAIIEITSPSSLAVISSTGAAALAGAIPGIGVLGAALAGGMVGAIEGNAQYGKAYEFNQRFAGKYPDYSNNLFSSLSDEFNKRGIQVEKISKQKVKLIDAKANSFDYNEVTTNADAIMHVQYRRIGYISPAFSSDFKPVFNLSVKLLDPNSKNEIFFSNFNIIEGNDISGKNESISVGSYTIFSDFESLSNRHFDAAAALVGYQPKIANGVVEKIIGTHTMVTGNLSRPVGPNNAVSAITSSANNLNPNPAGSPTKSESGTMGGLDPVDGSKATSRGAIQNETRTIGGVDPLIVGGVVGGFDPGTQAFKFGDEGTVPFISDRGREDYRTWLQWYSPKAFAISENGMWYGAHGNLSSDPEVPADPSQRALQFCEKRAKMPCKLYAVDRSVVFGQEMAAVPK